MGEFVFGTHNAPFVQMMYEQYLRDRDSVGPEWQALFDNGRLSELPIIPTNREEVIKTPATPPPPVTTSEPPAHRAPRTAPEPTAPAHSPRTTPHAPGSTLIPITGPASRLVQNMTESLSVPTATSFREIAVTLLDARRKAFNAALASASTTHHARRITKVSFTHLIGFAIVQAARELRVMTHAFQDVEGKPHRLDPGAVNLGLAVDVERKDGTRGLVVPVIKGADAMDFAAFHTTYEALVEKARTNKLLPDDFAGATITLTNPGTIGTVASVPRLMKGQGSIIATGAIRDVAGAKVMTITSTYDHRVIQGAESGTFLRRLDELLNDGEGFYERIAESMGSQVRGAPFVSSAHAAPSGAASVTTAHRAPRTSGELAAEFATAVSSLDDLKHVAAAMALVRAFRGFGYLAAPLDPLGTPPPGDPALDASRLGLNPEIMARLPADVLRIYVPGRTLAEALPELQRVWCGPIAYEVEHIASHEERVWLRQTIESGAHRQPLTPEQQRALLSRLTVVQALEEFLHKAYLGHKRFSIEGLDILVPMLDLLLDTVASAGTGQAVLGMAHRGRLNVLAHIVNVPYEAILEEFEGGRRTEDGEVPGGSTGDVKYHHGAEGVYRTTKGKDITVTLAPNPSHLEAVNPVVEGRARADQSDRTTPQLKHDPRLALPALIHGDAAFAAQGVVAETFNLARLKGYTTGGTIHFIANNQVGFTTDPKEGRSTDFASDMAKGFDVPIMHVNADDPEACLAAVRLAVLYRDKFRGDVVIDVVGYRRYGHNEADEPAYTQPAMYERIRQHPPVRQVYAERLALAGVLDPAAAAAESRAAYQRLLDLQQELKASLGRPVRYEDPRRVVRPTKPEPDTAVAADVLYGLNERLLAVPDGFSVHPKLKKQLDRRLEALGSEGAIEWAHAETLALASLLVEGTPVRLTGQDTERGTFSQRHLVLHDVATGNRFAPICSLPNARAPLELHNSPLSEYACLGFEYGYAVAAPETLVLWEAQFGDFANGAEVIIDQFIFSGLAKWGQTSRLTLLLPHGYEGQGPEHSSARLERFLALGAEGNIRVANCTTPAQYFHLLRRQARHAELRPLVVMTPKSLLRLPAATSRLDDLANGRFAPVLDDVDAAGRRDQATRLVLCSGKVYYDLAAAHRKEAAHIAIGRVELLYPFPVDELKALVASYPKLREVMWVQEEPRNMGARKFVLPKLRDLVPEGMVITDVSRPERASPAEGYPAAHQAEQARIVAAALA
jgi:2-oxoglutarate dehydrogenase E1 component